MIPSLLYHLNHAPIWHRRMRVWDQCVRASSLDRLLFLALHRYGCIGKQEVRLLRKLIRPGMRIVDIGANIGLYSLLLADLAGETGQIYSFEPEPNLFATLHENCTANRITNIVAYPYAAGAATGRALLRRSPFNSGNNSLAQTNPGAESLEVETVTIDSVLPERVIDFIKIDVQGHELAALTGMQELLAASPQVRIFFEFWPAGLSAAGSTPDHLFAFLRERGFTIYRPQENDRCAVVDLPLLIAELGSTRYINLIASRSEVPDDN